MAKKSAGLLVYQEKGGQVDVLLVHPGGPLWAKKDEGTWSIPKGEIEGDEEPLMVAMREYQEETGSLISGDFTPLQPLRQPGGKIVFAWAIEGDFDPEKLKSNTFTMEWPPKSGKKQVFPEVDRAEWFSIEVAKKKILKGQQRFILQLVDLLGMKE